MNQPLRDTSLRPLFHPDAYEFLKFALRFTVHQTSRVTDSGSVQQAPAEPGMPDESQHVSGQELLEGIRLYALDQYGLMTMRVFDHWGITNTEDWGRMVFELIDRGEMYKTDNGAWPEGGTETVVVLLMMTEDKKGQPQPAYLEKIPMDAWGEPLQYKYPADNTGRMFNKPLIFSFGPDRDDGGNDTISNIDDLT